MHKNEMPRRAFLAGTGVACRGEGGSVLPVSQPDTGAMAVLVDEDDAGGFEGALDGREGAGARVCRVSQ